MLKNLEPKKVSSFRSWLQLKWIEHLDEYDNWNLPKPKYSSTNYFQTYKWWLKREYRHQQKS